MASRPQRSWCSCWPSTPRDWTRLERRAALDRAVRERREYVLPARFDDTPLPGLLSGMVAVDLGTRPPEQFAAMIAAKLTAVGIIGQAGDPVSETGVARPPGAIRVAEADLRRLGVHDMRASEIGATLSLAYRTAACPALERPAAHTCARPAAPVVSSLIP